MKRKLVKMLLIYLCVFIYLFLVSFIYSLYLMKNEAEVNRLILILIGGSSFFILGLLYSCIFKCRALILGIIVGLTHAVLINLIFLFSYKKISIDYIPLIIYIISSTIGAIIPTLFKKSR